MRGELLDVRGESLEMIASLAERDLVLGAEEEGLFLGSVRGLGCFDAVGTYCGLSMKSIECFA